MIPPGSTRSARLGNQSTGAQGERLTYTINVTAQNSQFIYKYAVVLQDPGHSPAQQPVFQMRLLRWGAIIWDNHNHEIGWGGKDANGFDITQGTYTWKIILKSPCSDNRKAYVGHLNLLR